MSEGRWVSPNEILEAGKRIMLEGREPESKKDWALLVNFFSANLSKEVGDKIIVVLCKILNVPLKDEEIIYIWEYQKRASKAREAVNN